MTERNFTQELLYTNYVDMENGDDVESIDYRSLIHILTEMMTRIEKLESDDAPWLDTTYDGFNEEQALKALDKLYQENNSGMEQLANE